VKSNLGSAFPKLYALGRNSSTGPTTANSWTSRDRLSLDNWEAHATGLLECHMNTS